MLIETISILVLMTPLITECRSAGDDDWWKYMELYQIYPRSFKDSDGDGIGDLKGITENLEHLADIGVDAAWISPIFVSPMKDFGYDISDFYKISKEYGTLEDLHELVAKAKSLGIRIFLDYVPNHSSDQCEWFKLSVQRAPGYENFYLWHPGKINATGHRIPPSNWISAFRNSAWTWHEVRQEYYFHQFLKEQPDFNFRDPNVIAEFNNVLRYWLKQGVDGFRVDAVRHLMEADVDENGNYPDEPRSGLSDNEIAYSYLDHIHTREQEETYNRVFEWRKTIDDFALETQSDPKILLVESMSDIWLIMPYYGNSTHKGAHFPFNFQLLLLPSDVKAVGIKESIDYWFEYLPEGCTSNWVIGNHDQSRLASHFGPRRSDGFVMLGLLLPGTSITYYGEEIAMVDQFLSYEDTLDPQACKNGPLVYHASSRDPARTPFQWDTTKNSGFSTANKTWLPLADNYLTLNLANQKSAPRSAYKVFKDFSIWRKHPSIKYGDFQIETFNDVLAFKRSDDIYKFLMVFNTVEIPTTINVNEKFSNFTETLDVIIASVESRRNKGDIVSSSAVELDSFEALLLRTRSLT